MSTSPLTHPDCDLRDFAFMPMDVVRLRDSDFAALSDGDEFRAGILLWCASWHQVPAASLPDDDTVLARLAGYGRVIKEWLKVRSGALRGWIKCSDGRLYHPVVAEKANEAWRAKLKQRWATECARLKKQCQRHKQPYNPPTFEEWMSLDCPEGHTANVPGDIPKMSQGQQDDVPPESPGKRTPRDRDIDITTTTDTSVSSVVGDTYAWGRGGVPVPGDFQPCRTARMHASQFGLDLDIECAKFIAHHQAAGSRRDDVRAWQAQFRKWLLDAMQINADRNRGSPGTSRSFPDYDEQRRAAANTLSVGSHYLNPEDGGDYEQLPA
jgi:hypothetical protein